MKQFKIWPTNPGIFATNSDKSHSATCRTRSENHRQRALARNFELANADVAAATRTALYPLILRMRQQRN
jgi:hypothetical protein